MAKQEKREMEVNPIRTELVTPDSYSLLSIIDQSITELSVVYTPHVDSVAV